MEMKRDFKVAIATYYFNVIVVFIVNTDYAAIVDTNCGKNSILPPTSFSYSITTTPICVIVYRLLHFDVNVIITPVI